MCGSGGFNSLPSLFCMDCGECYHEFCIVPGLNLSPTAKLTWRCPKCKICEICGDVHLDSEMILCDSCDKSYGLKCLHPKMNKVIDDDFICSLCVDCRHCMYRDDRRRWSNNIGGPCQFCLHEVGNYNTTQTMVYQANEAKKLTKHGNFSTGGSLLGHKMPTVTMAVPVNTIKNCIVCDKEHSLTTNHMVRCDVCECWVHETCDKNLMNNSKKLNYSCPKCIRMFSIVCSTFEGTK